MATKNIVPKSQLSFSDTYSKMKTAIDAALENRPATAFSTDGRAFVFQAPLLSPLQVGSYVLITSKHDTEARHYLGQVVARDVATEDGPEYSIDIDTHGSFFLGSSPNRTGLRQQTKLRYTAGFGAILGKPLDGQYLDTTASDVFKEADIAPAPAAQIKAYISKFEKQDTIIPIGYVSNTNPDPVLNEHIPVPCSIKAEGLERPTLLCGQSGSGKSFALGIIVEQLLLSKKDWSILILDPNSDFVYIDDIKDISKVNETTPVDLSGKDYDRYKSLFKQKVWPELLIGRQGDFASKEKKHLVINFSDLTTEDQASVLQLDPIRDREEYYAFRQIIENLQSKKGTYDLADVANAVQEDYDNHMRLIGLRMSNLRVRHWEILRADDGAGFFSFLEGKWKAVVIDLGSISNEAEKMTLAGAILSRIWSKREARKPVLVVADEAHYLAPPEPTTRLQESTCEYLVRIAGEGRKYGISLLVASQRPAKIHPSVVSQCDNLFLMKMSLQEDLNTIAGTFPRVPRAFIEHASSFRLGEVLVSGRVVRNPTFARFGGRLLREGGSDVRV